MAVHDGHGSRHPNPAQLTHLVWYFVNVFNFYYALLCFSELSDEPEIVEGVVYIERGERKSTVEKISGKGTSYYPMLPEHRHEMF